MLRQCVLVALVPFLMSVAIGCGGSTEPADEAGDERDASFIDDGRADSSGVPVEGSELALAVLEVANTASFEELDIDAELNARSARNIVDHRNGPDDTDGTADDDPFDTLQELDDVPWVGPAALEALIEYANEQPGPTVVGPAPKGWVKLTTPDDQLPTWFSRNSGMGPWGGGYNPAFYWIFQGSMIESVTRVPVGDKIELEEGTYDIVLNGTSTEVEVREGEGIEIEAARIEVANVGGSFVVLDEYLNGTYSSVITSPEAIDTGHGIDVLPGEYRVEVDYQGSQREYSRQLAPGQLELIEPPNIRAQILVRSPGTTVDDYQFPGTSSAQYRGPDGSSSSLKIFGYDSQVVHVYRGNEEWDSFASEFRLMYREYVGSTAVGEPMDVDSGKYRLVVNNTIHDVEVGEREQATPRLGRLELVGFGDGAEILVKTDASTTLNEKRDVFDNEYFPSDVGVNVFPGDFNIAVYGVDPIQRYEVTVR